MGDRSSASDWLRRRRCGRPGDVRLYADHPDRRFRQVLGDVLGLVVVLGAIPAGRGLYGWLRSYAEPGRKLEVAAGGLADNLRGAADTIGGVIRNLAQVEMARLGLYIRARPDVR